MTKIISVILVLLISIWAGIQLKTDPGYVLIAIHGWTIETTLWIAIPSLMLFFILLHTLLLVLRWLAHIPVSWHQWIIKRRAQHTNKETQQHIYLQRLLELIKQNQESEVSKFVKKLPKKIARDPDIIITYSQYLLDNHQDKKAEALLRHYLKKQFDEHVITVYGLIKQDKAQLAFAESLLKKNPHSAALYLCLGRISQSKHLWGKARIYFEKSIELAPTSAAYSQLGLLLEELDQLPDAYKIYKTGLIRSELTRNCTS
jgi:uncharacterized protein HemY